MSFINNTTKFLFTYNGRITRSKWLFGFFASFFVGAVSLVVFSLLLGLTMGFFSAITGTETIVDQKTVKFILSSFLYLVTFYALFCLIVKRLHDVNKSAWLFLLWLFSSVGVLLGVFGTVPNPSPSENTILVLLFSLVLGGVSLVFFIWILFVVFFMRGSKGDNKYGPDPLALKDVVSSSVE